MSLEHILRRSLDGFTDRDSVVARVKQTLAMAQTGQLYLLSIKGSSGVGKTFLLSYLAEYVCPQLQWQPVYINLGQELTNSYTILTALETVLTTLVQEQDVTGFRVQQHEIEDRYHKNRKELINKRTNASIPLRNEEVKSLLWTEALQMRASKRHILCDLAQKHTTPLCFLLDDYDQLLEANYELAEWLWKGFFAAFVKTVPYPVVVVACGKVWTSTNVEVHGGLISSIVSEEELPGFNLFQVKTYLEKNHILVANSSLAEQGELISFFYELTQGHPLSLELAGVYFKTFEREERTAKALQVYNILSDNYSPFKSWLERLLVRLPEPERTLLERAPILRSFTQETLQVLLDVASKGAPERTFSLDQQGYHQFLSYPFFNQAIGQQPLLTLHQLIRRVQLRTLRLQYPQLHEQLQRAMMDYYMAKLWGPEQASLVVAAPQDTIRRRDRLLRWLRNDAGPVDVVEPQLLKLDDKIEATDELFGIVVEYLYHMLQVKEMQEGAFKQWKTLLEGTIESGQRERAGMLWEVMYQLSIEDETFLSKSSGSNDTVSNLYNQYRQLYAQYVEYDTRTINILRDHT